MPSYCNPDVLQDWCADWRSMVWNWWWRNGSRCMWITYIPFDCSPKSTNQEGGLNHQLDKLGCSVYTGQSLSLATLSCLFRGSRDSSGRDQRLCMGSAHISPHQDPSPATAITRAQPNKKRKYYSPTWHHSMAGLAHCLDCSKITLVHFNHQTSSDLFCQ